MQSIIWQPKTHGGLDLTRLGAMILGVHLRLAYSASLKCNREVERNRYMLYKVTEFIDFAAFDLAL